jgi:hypothetical protein
LVQVQVDRFWEQPRTLSAPVRRAAILVPALTANVESLRQDVTSGWVCPCSVQRVHRQLHAESGDVASAMQIGAAGESAMGWSVRNASGAGERGNDQRRMLRGQAEIGGLVAAFAGGVWQEDVPVR